MHRALFASSLLFFVACSGRQAPRHHPDAGLPVDAGHVIPDSSAPVDAPAPPDTGVRPDAGQMLPDAGPRDGGSRDAGFDAGPPDAGFDAGPPDAGFDAGPPDAGFDAGPPDAGTFRCTAEPSVSPRIFFSDCPMVRTACAPGASCICADGCSLTECTDSSCTGTTSGAVLCQPSVFCDLDISGGGMTCAECGAYATCHFYGSFSGGQQVICDEGSDCTVDLSMASGGRVVDCSRAARCRVNLGGSGWSQVVCGPDCVVTNGPPSSLNQICCDMSDPVMCADGSVTCGECPP